MAFFFKKENGTTPDKIHLAMTADYLAEVIFSLCIIILEMMLFISMIEFLSILLKDTAVAKFKISPELINKIKSNCESQSINR